MYRTVFTDPSSVLKQAKKEKSLSKSMLLLLQGAIILSIAAFLAPRGGFMGESLPQGTMVGIALFIIAFSFLWSLLQGLLVQFAFKVLLDKGSYFDAITPIAYAIHIASTGLLGFVILSYIPFVGVALGGLALLFAIILATFLAYRMYMDFYGIDLLTAISVLFIVKFSTMVVFYISIAHMLLNVTNTYRHMGPFSY